MADHLRVAVAGTVRLEAAAVAAGMVVKQSSSTPRLSRVARLRRLGLFLPSVARAAWVAFQQAAIVAVAVALAGVVVAQSSSFMPL